MRVLASLLKHPLKPLFILSGLIYIFMVGNTEIPSSESLFSVHENIFNEAFIRVKAFIFFSLSFLKTLKILVSLLNDKKYYML